MSDVLSMSTEESVGVLVWLLVWRCRCWVLSVEGCWVGCAGGGSGVLGGLVVITFMYKYVIILDS
jgi:hypothetical protein